VSEPAMNTDPPGVRCGMCGGKARPWRAPVGKQAWIECASGFPGEPPCSWSSHDPRRAGPWWRLRIWLGPMTTATVAPPNGNGFAVLLCMFLLVSAITCVVLWIHERRSDAQTTRSTPTTSSSPASRTRWANCSSGSASTSPRPRSTTARRR
jgi:hypothetical protein